jgi:ribosomal-protein-alanine N-acetyltransferase
MVNIACPINPSSMDTMISTTLDSRVSVVPANWRDLNMLRALEQVCFPKDIWPLWDLIGVLTLPNVIRLKAIGERRMVGFIAGDVRRSEGVSWIATIGVLPEYRRRGIGAALLQACEDQLVSITPIIRLSVRASNRAALRLYEGFGYHHYTMWEKYYSDGEDAIVLEKSQRDNRL